jgi:hypothetical protein
MYKLFNLLVFYQEQTCYNISNLNFLGADFAGFLFLKTACATILPQNSEY